MTDHKVLALALLSASLVMAGCGGTSKSAASTPRATATVTVTVTAQPSPDVPAPTGDADSRLRATWQSSGGNTIRVLEYRRSAPGAYAPDGERWDAVLVKTCVGTDEPAALAWSPWRLLDADSGQYEASGETAGDFLAPQYPFAGERSFSKGECVKGWIYFGVPTDARLRKVNYANDAGDSHSWRLKG